MSAASGKQLLAEARWYRAEYARTTRELERMTPGHADAIGPAAVRRLHADHETFLQLAEEIEAYLRERYPELVDQAPAVDDAPSLF